MQLLLCKLLNKFSTHPVSKGGAEILNVFSAADHVALRRLYPPPLPPQPCIRAISVPDSSLSGYLRCAPKSRIIALKEERGR